MRVTIWVTGGVYRVGCANSMARDKGQLLVSSELNNQAQITKLEAGMSSRR